jgi:hypothetical protein
MHGRVAESKSWEMARGPGYQILKAGGLGSVGFADRAERSHSQRRGDTDTSHLAASSQLKLDIWDFSERIVPDLRVPWYAVDYASGKQGDSWIVCGTAGRIDR